MVDSISTETPDLQRLEAEILRQKKVIDALMKRAERTTRIQASEFSLFETAVVLGEEVRRRTEDLATALRENEQVNRALQQAKSQMEGENQQRRTYESKLVFSNILLRATMENCPDGVCVVGENGQILSSNRQFVRMWDLPPHLLSGGKDVLVRYLASRVDDPAGYIALVAHIYGQTQAPSRDEITLSDGRVFDRRSGILRSQEGRYLGRVWFFRDITESKRAEAKILQMARHDLVTGLPNRGAFVEVIEQAMARSDRGGRGFAVLYLDLDRFKNVNDTLGHPLGDLLLKAVAARMHACMRASDLVARFGGDEFAVLQADLQDPAEAGFLAERIVEVIAEPYTIDGNVTNIGASIGIAVYGPKSPDAETLLSHADVALYRAKAEGRGTYRFFTEAMDREVRSRFVLAAELRTAIQDGQLFLVYQPQVDVDSGRVIGLEALVRWRHPKRGIVPPSEFIAAAEENGLIVALGRWVLLDACRQGRKWLDDGLAVPSIAVNISAVQFKAPLELERSIATILAETGLPTRLLEIELTESGLMETSRVHSDVLERLKQAGIRIAIDDFGTGYSSLDYLRRFPVDRIKIAQQFIDDLTSNDGAIVKAAISLGAALRVEVIAEGVETAAQLRVLRRLGCRYVQGFHFAKPMPVPEVAILLRSGFIDQAPAEMSAEAAVA